MELCKTLIEFIHPSLPCTTEKHVRTFDIIKTKFKKYVRKYEDMSQCFPLYAIG